MMIFGTIKQSQESINIVLYQSKTSIGSIYNNNIKLPSIINLGICDKKLSLFNISICLSMTMIPVVPVQNDLFNLLLCFN